MPLAFHHPLLFLVSLIFSLFAIYRLHTLHTNILPKNSKLFFALGLFLLALAAGSPDFLHRPLREVAVLVDRSDSTRNAQYHDEKHLHNRITQLLGHRPYRIVEFSTTGADATRLPRLKPDQSVLLFSDGRFPIPDGDLPPIYPVIDPGLINPYDARISDISLSKTLDVSLQVFTPLDPQLHITQLPTTRASQGNYTMHLPIPDSQRIVARINPIDPWPENDALELLNLPPSRSQRWWLGDGAPQNYQFCQFLPSDPANYLLPSAIVLHNIPADAIEPHLQTLLTQYVRDLGGSLVIFGAQNAFAAGGYPGTALETLSPLSSVSPTPARHWIILVDASGSMEQESRFPKAVQAVENILSHLPQNDPATLACFSSGLTYIAKTQIPSKVPLDKLRDQSPKGPTNLETSLNQLIEDLPLNSQPAELLLVSDLDAPIEQSQNLLQNLQSKNIRLHLLALSEKSQGLAALTEISKQTQGRMIQENDPQKWSQAARKLQLAATTPPFINAPTPITSTLLNFTSETPDLLQRLWLKPNAAPLATSPDAKDVFIAKWNFGLGTVIAASYDTKNATLLADLIASKPTHPNYRVSWKHDSVQIDCVEDSKPINRLNLILRISGHETPIPQIAPGLYRASLPRQKASAFAAVWLDHDLIDQTLVPGKYPEEFDAVGNDDYTLSKLAELTNGQVIGSAIQKPIVFNDPIAKKPLAVPLAVLAVLSLSAGLFFWRRN